MKKLLPFLLTLAALAVAPAALHAQAPKPLKLLLITGGCCHDYAKQKDILKQGIEARINAVVEHIHSDDKSTKPPLSLYGNPDYAKGYDLVIHDECSGGILDMPVVEGVIKPHRDGIPGVNLHCAMHSYGKGNGGKALDAGQPATVWNEYLGLQSSSHGPQIPIDITFTDKTHPITKNLADWTTIKEELYNNHKIFPTAHALASGKQIVKQKKKDADGVETETEKEVNFVVAWTNMYGKTRVFNTTIGHNNATVEDARYLDLVSNGILWAADKLGDDGKPKTGFAAAK